MSSTDLSSLVRRADVCAVAIADCFRGDGEILANPIGTTPMIGGRLARATYEPDLMMTDGEAGLIANDEAIPAVGDRRYETWNPYRRMFDVVWSGRRHVMMGATQVDRYGNQNIAGLGGTPQRPRTQLLGFRGRRATPSTTRPPTGCPTSPPRCSSPPSTWSPASATTAPRISARRPLASTRSGGSSPTSGSSTSRPTTTGCGSAPSTRGHRRRRRRLHRLRAGHRRRRAHQPVALPEELRLLDEVIDPRGTRFREVPDPQ